MDGKARRRLTRRSMRRSGVVVAVAVVATTAMAQRDVEEVTGSCRAAGEAKGIGASGARRTGSYYGPWRSGDGTREH